MRRLLRYLGDRLTLLRLCTKTTAALSSDYWRMAAAGARLMSRRRFGARELLTKGFLSPLSHRKALEIFLSRAEGTKLQEAVNPTTMSPVLKNKAIFYATLKAAGLPHPEVYATFDRKAAGCDLSGRILATELQWVEFFRKGLPAAFVIKPVTGSEGKGVLVLDRAADGFRCGSAVYSAGDLYRHMVNYPHCNSFIIQRKLTSHPGYEALTGPKAVQTVRIVTFVRKDSQTVIIWALPKFIVGDNVIDNTCGGRTRNFYATADKRTGRLLNAFAFNLDNGTVEAADVHPDTGRRLDEFTIPCWQEMLELVNAASRVFLPVRSIGWDVAITEQGPSIVEGNIWWEIGGGVANVAPIIDDLGYCPYDYFHDR